MMINSQRGAERITKDGAYRASNNLYLLVRGNSKIWVYRSMNNCKRTNKSLGSLRAVNYLQAQQTAVQMNLFKAEKQVDTAAALIATSTLENATKAYIEHRQAVLSPKYQQEILALIKRYTGALWDTPINQIETRQVQDALGKIWLDKVESSNRALQHLERIFAYAQVDFDKALIIRSLPERKVAPKHFASLSFKETKKLMQELCKKNSQSSLATRFIALSALRSNTARQLRWAMINTEQQLINIPSAIIKGDVLHKMGADFRMPITPAMNDILVQSRQYQVMAGIESEYIFANAQGDYLSDKALLANLNGKSTIHGFRATFRTWCAEHKQDYFACEMQMMHQVFPPSVLAYFKTDLLQERTALLMQYQDDLLGCDCE